MKTKLLQARRASAKEARKHEAEIVFVRQDLTDPKKTILVFAARFADHSWQVDADSNEAMIESVPDVLAWINGDLQVAE